MGIFTHVLCELSVPSTPLTLSNFADFEMQTEKKEFIKIELI